MVDYKILEFQSISTGRILELNKGNNKYYYKKSNGQYYQNHRGLQYLLESKHPNGSNRFRIHKDNSKFTQLELFTIQEEMVTKKKTVTKKQQPVKEVEKVVVKSKTELEKIQELILRTYPKIRITILKKRKENLEEFLFRFFNEWNHEKDTIVIETREVQTAKSRRRSLGDMFMLCRYYYPKCTLKEVATALYKGMFKRTFANDYKMRSSFCGGTQRRMFYITNNKDSIFYDPKQNDEFGFSPEWYLKELEK